MVEKVKKKVLSVLPCSFYNINACTTGLDLSITGLHLPGFETTSGFGRDALSPVREGTMCQSPQEDRWPCVLLGLDMLMLQTLNQLLKPFHRC